MAENDNSADREALFLEIVNQMSAEEQADLQQLMEWIAQRPKGSERLGPHKIKELFDDIRRENTRRRLGGRVGVILPFMRPEK